MVSTVAVVPGLILTLGAGLVFTVRRTLTLIETKDSNRDLD